jgi:type III secretory pathway component EscS
MSLIRRLIQYTSTTLYILSLLAIPPVVCVLVLFKTGTDKDALIYALALFSVVAMLASSVLKYAGNILNVGEQIASDSEKESKSNKVSDSELADRKSGKQEK